MSITTNLPVVLLVVVQTLSQYGPPYPSYFRPPGPPQPQIIEGSYTFIDPSGMKKTVQYKSDGTNGFNAVVQPEPPKEKEGNQTTTAAPDTKKEPETKIQYVPVPVYPPNLASRSFGPPYSSYSPNPYRTIYAFSPFG